MLTSSSSSNRTDSSIATFSSWYFSDNGIGTSIENETATEFSDPDNFEKQICDLQLLRQKLMEEETKKENVLKKIGFGKNKFDQERLEAEKNVLSSTLRTKLLLRDFRDKYESQKHNKFFDIGLVTISNIKLQYNQSRHSKKFKQYFLCALTSGSKLFLSQIVQADSKDVVNFNMNHTFFNLPTNFEIGISVYILQVKKKTFKDKCLRWFKNGIQENNNWKRESMFKLWKETTVKISNLNETNEVLLELVNSKLCKLIFDVKASVDASIFSRSGWVDLSRNGLFWNQRWCVLNGTELKLFYNPTDDFFNSQCTTIDLKSCILVRPSRRHEISRARAIVLEMDSESHNPFSYYLSTVSFYDFYEWLRLDKVVETLQFWKKYGCL